MNLIIDHQSQHLPINHHRLGLNHFSYLAIFICCLLLPFINQLIFIMLLYLNLHLLLVIIWSTYHLRNLLPFRYHFIIYYWHLRPYFSIHLYFLATVLKIKFNLLHFQLLHELSLILCQHHLLLLMFRFVILLIDFPSHTNHFFINLRLLKILNILFSSNILFIQVFIF